MRPSARSAGEPTDVAVLDIGHLLQHQVLDLGFGAARRRSRPCVDQQGVTGLERYIHQRGRQVHHLLLVGMTDDQRPFAALEHLAHAHFADDVKGSGLDDGERLVQDLLTPLQRVDGDRRRNPHPTATGEDLDRPVGRLAR